MKKQLMILCLIASLSSCKYIFHVTTFNKKSANGSASIIRGRQLDSQGTFFMSFYDATKRSSTMFITPEGQLHVLSENNPDAATNRAFDLINKLHFLSAKDTIGASNQLSMAKTIVQLTEKSPADILVRDALYRLNEMYLNTLCLNCGKKGDTTSAKCGNSAQALTTDNYVSLFKGILKTATEITSIDARVTEAKTKQLEILDSIKILKDSILKLNNPNKVEKDSASNTNQDEKEGSDSLTDGKKSSEKVKKAIKKKKATAINYQLFYNSPKNIGQEYFDKLRCGVCHFV